MSGAAETALSNKLREKGLKTSDEQLLEIARVAWQKWPSPVADGARKGYVRERILSEKLAWHFVERKRQGLMDMLMLDLLRVVEPKPTRNGHLHNSHDIWEGHHAIGGRGTSGPDHVGGQHMPETHLARAADIPSSDTIVTDGTKQPWQILRDTARASSAGDQAEAGTLIPIVPSAAEDLRREAKHRVHEQLGRLWMFQVDGISVKDMTIAQAKNLQAIQVGRHRHYQRLSAVLAKLCMRGRDDQTIWEAWSGDLAGADHILAGLETDVVAA